MAYTNVNFKTKKALKDAIAEGKKISTWSPGPYPTVQNGSDTIEGPHYPKPHKWYAQVVVENGYIVKVK